MQWWTNLSLQVWEVMILFNRLKKLYMADRLTEAGLENAVLKGWITEEQKAAIIAEKADKGEKPNGEQGEQQEE